MGGDTPDDARANDVYYRACVGRWVCVFAPEVRDFVALRGAVGWLTALGLYRIRVLGADMVQTTLREDDRVTLTQELPGYRAVAPLDRVSR